MLNAEFVAAIAELKRLAVEPRCVDLGDPTKKAVVVGGGMNTFEVPPPCRNYKFGRIADLLLAAEVYGTSHASLWVSARRLVVLFGDEHRRDRGSIDLVESDEFAALCKLSGEWLGHKEFVRALRYDLASAVPESLLGVVRKVRVAGATTKDSEVNPGRERGMAEFQRELANAADVPEFFPVKLSVFGNPGLKRFTFTLRVGLEIDLDRVMFQLVVPSGELRDALDDALANIVELASESFTGPSFIGDPDPK